MRDPFPMNLNKEDVRQCGRVAVWSAMLDTAMEVTIWLLCGLPRPDARRSTVGLMADQKRQRLEGILQSCSGLTSDQRKDLAEILKDVADALKERNRVIHALWHIGADGAPWAAKYDKKGQLIFHDRFDTPFVKPIAERNKQLAIRLARWNNAFEPNVMSSYYPPV